MNVNPKYTTHMGGKPVVGMWRDVMTHIPKLAQLYLTVNSWREDKIHAFSQYNSRKCEPELLMLVLAIGCDGAPICGTVVLVSFLNVGERIASSDA